MATDLGNIDGGTTDPGITVTGSLDAETTGAATELAARVERADGVAGLSEQSVAAIGGDRVTHVLVRSHPDDTLIGYANITPGRDGNPAMIEAVVDDAARGRGVGDRLVSAALAQAGSGARIWAHGDLPAARAVAASHDLAPLRELLSLRRPLGDPDLPLPELSVPDDLELRTYRGAEDDAEILRVNNVAFDWHPEQGGWDLAQIHERTAADWFDPDGLFLVFDRADTSTLLGFHWTKVHPATDTEPAIGEVYVVGVDPSAQGRGLGHLLTLAGIAHLERRDLRVVELYVEGDNAAALHTYDRLGFTRHSIDVAYGRPPSTNTHS